MRINPMDVENAPIPRYGQRCFFIFNVGDARTTGGMYAAPYMIINVGWRNHRYVTGLGYVPDRGVLMDAIIFNLSGNTT